MRHELVHNRFVEIAKMRADGREAVMIGHAGHPEVEGTMGRCEDGVHLVETLADVAALAVRDPSRLSARIGVTAGASTPERLVQQVIARLRALGTRSVDERSGVVETVVFPMPKGLGAGRAPPTRDVANRIASCGSTVNGVFAKPGEQRDERGGRDEARRSCHERVPPVLRERAAERFGDVERQQQREPLPRTPRAARGSRQQQGERQRLQREPGRMSAKRREHQFPQQLEEQERERSCDGEPRCLRRSRQVADRVRMQARVAHTWTDRFTRARAPTLRSP